MQGLGNHVRPTLVVLAGLATIALAGCNSSAQSRNPSGQPPAPLVMVTEVAAADVPIFSEYPAQTYARNMVDVRGRVDGYIEKWLFRPGQEVHGGPGAVHPGPAAVPGAGAAGARATLKQTEADLDFAQRQVSLRQAEANLAAAQSNLVKAQQDYERLKPLVEQDAAAKQDLDAAVAALRSGRGQRSRQPGQRGADAALHRDPGAVHAGQSAGAARRAAKPPRSTCNTAPSARPSAA